MFYITYINFFPLYIVVFTIYFFYLFFQANIIDFTSIDNIFNYELKLLYTEKYLYNNLSNIKNISELYDIRKKSPYRKIGYGGHPKKYCFSFPLDNLILLSPIDIGKTIDLFIFIHSRPEEFYERLLSRKYIISSNGNKVIYITSKSKNNEVNKKLRIESNMYKDILQFNEFSSYFNLSIQTSHMIIWSCGYRFKYLIKSDIDVFINVPLIHSMLIYFKVENKYFALGKISKTYVLRNKRYSHYVPKEIIKENMYPPYLQGVGYIIPYNTVKIIAETIVNIKPKIWIEDVFIGYLFMHNNVTLIDISKYILREIPNNLSKFMHSANNYMFIHGLYPMEILTLNQYK